MSELKLDIEQAYKFYKDYLLKPARSKSEIYRRYRFNPPSIHPSLQLIGKFLRQS